LDEQVSGISGNSGFGENQVHYGKSTYDDSYEYKLVGVPGSITSPRSPGRLLKEAEWRALGIELPSCWAHHKRAAISTDLLQFRRKLGFCQYCRVEHEDGVPSNSNSNISINININRYEDTPHPQRTAAAFKDRDMDIDIDIATKEERPQPP